MAYNTITLKGTPIVHEAVAAAGLTPGHLCEFTSAGTVQKHATLGGNAYPMFALENDHEGEDNDHAYVAAEQVQLGVFTAGSEVWALLANGETAVIGSYLESAGGGTLQVLDADASVGLVKTNSIIGVARTAVDMSGSSGVDPSPRIRVMII